MNEQELLERNLSPQQIEEITGSEKHIHRAIKEQQCVETFTTLRHLLPDMTGVMMEKIKREINLEMKRRRDE